MRHFIPLTLCEYSEFTSSIVEDASLPLSKLCECMRTRLCDLAILRTGTSERAAEVVIKNASVVFVAIFFIFSIICFGHLANGFMAAKVKKGTRLPNRPTH